MNSRNLLSSALAMAIMGGFLTANPNPVDPRAFLVLSEVQVIDPSHWTVEFLYTNKFHTVALMSDTFTYDYSLVNKSIDTSIHPKIPVKKNGYGLITPQQYPTLQLHPGDTVRLLWNHFGMSPWECVIDSNLKPTQSMAAFQRVNICPSFPPYSYLEWLIDATPTLGYANDSTRIFGVLKIFVFDKDSQPLFNVPIYYQYINICSMISRGTYYTNDSGYALTYKLQSSQTYKYTVNNQVFGPFHPIPGCTTAVTCMLNDYYTSVPAPRAARGSHESSARFLTLSYDRRGGSVLFVFNSGTVPDDFRLSVFSPSGRLLYTSHIPNSGSGTYSAVWKNGARAGNYIARIRSQSASVEQRFTIR